MSMPIPQIKESRRTRRSESREVGFSGLLHKLDTQIVLEGAISRSGSDGRKSRHRIADFPAPRSPCCVKVSDRYRLKICGFICGFGTSSEWRISGHPFVRLALPEYQAEPSMHYHLPGRRASLGRAEWSSMPCTPSFLYHFQLLRSRQWMSSSARRRISRAACERGAKSTNALKYPYSCPGGGASSSISMAMR